MLCSFIKMDGKKISFGFSKTLKKPNILPSGFVNKKEKVELIKCLEGQEIKLVEDKQDEEPLVIPLKENQKTSVALASLMKRRAVLLNEADPTPSPNKNTTKPVAGAIEDESNLEKRAANELLSELQSNDNTTKVNNIVLPMVVKADDLPLEGAKESTLDDYDSIPIQDFGMAMLRGMGWIEPPKKKKSFDDETPLIRPKGMGLGADKALKARALLVPPAANEALVIKKQAFVRVLGGKHKDLYGQIEGFDDHAGRVIVKMAIGGVKESFNEFLCQPVSQKEYLEYGKCLNTTKYVQYKKLENENGQIIENKDMIDEKRSIKTESSYSQKADNLRGTKATNRVGGIGNKTERNVKNENERHRYFEAKRDNVEKERYRSPSQKTSRNKKEEHSRYNRRRVNGSSSQSRSTSESSKTEYDSDSPYAHNKNKSSGSKINHSKSKKKSDSNERIHRKKFKKKSEKRKNKRSRSVSKHLK